MIEEGRLDEVREMDEKYPRPEEPKPTAPTGPGPVTYTVGGGDSKGR